MMGVAEVSQDGFADRAAGHGAQRGLLSCILTHRGGRGGSPQADACPREGGGTY